MKKEIIITPKIWGPYLWNFLHYLSYNLFDNLDFNQKKQIFLFFISLEYIIPCKICKTHYKIYLRENMINEEKINKSYLIKWVCDLHNNINKRLNKKEYSFKECIKHNKILKKKKFIKFITIFLFYNSNKKNISINEFNYNKQFFISLSNIYPDKSIRQKLKLEIEKSFNKIYSIKQLKKWYSNNFNILL